MVYAQYDIADKLPARSLLNLEYFNEGAKTLAVRERSMVCRLERKSSESTLGPPIPS